MKRATLTLAVFFILFFIILIASFVLKDPASSENPSSADKIILEQGNGAVINIWIDSFSRFDTLKDRNVKYLFVDVGGTGKDGKIETPEIEIKSFLDFVGKYETVNNYDFIILPYSEVMVENYDITSESFKNNFVQDYVNLDYMGFDGILVDIEGIPLDKRGDYLILLERLRNGLSKDSIISVYAGALVDSDSEWEWNHNFYKLVSDRVDLISASGYDSDMTDAEGYKEYIKNQVDEIASGNFTCKFLFAVPTHKAYPETIENALAAYTEELKKHPKNNFLGVCVFAEWTADQNEWYVFEKYINK